MNIRSKKPQLKTLRKIIVVGLCSVLLSFVFLNYGFCQPAPKSCPRSITVPEVGNGPGDGDTIVNVKSIGGGITPGQAKAASKAVYGAIASTAQSAQKQFKNQWENFRKAAAASSEVKSPGTGSDTTARNATPAASAGRGNLATGSKTKTGTDYGPDAFAKLKQNPPGGQPSVPDLAKKTFTQNHATDSEKLNPQSQKNDLAKKNNLEQSRQRAEALADKQQQKIADSAEKPSMAKTQKPTKTSQRPGNLEDRMQQLADRTNAKKPALGLDKSKTLDKLEKLARTNQNPVNNLETKIQRMVDRVNVQRPTRAAFQSPDINRLQGLAQRETISLANTRSSLRELSPKSFDSKLQRLAGINNLENKLKPDLSRLSRENSSMTRLADLSQDISQLASGGFDSQEIIDPELMDLAGITRDYTMPYQMNNDFSRLAEISSEKLKRNNFDEHNAAKIASDFSKLADLKLKELPLKEALNSELKVSFNRLSRVSDKLGSPDLAKMQKALSPAFKQLANLRQDEISNSSYSTSNLIKNSTYAVPVNGSGKAINYKSVINV
ncbi:MAG: hypothetical protein PHE97_07560, partial [Candidatus Omnitrophica bacterium]|nr:hypothetical protein [Candidatus Omnitrophota bacterium]